MSKVAKNIFYILCFLPFAAKIPYMVSAWRMSPLESGDPLMWFAVVASAFFCEFMRRKIGISRNEEPYQIPILFIIAVLVGFWVAIGFKINAFGILFGIAVAALATDLRFGRVVFISQMPTYAFAVLGTPSVSYWLDYYLHFGLGGAFSYLMAKFFLATAFLLIWVGVAYVKKRYPLLINIIFYVVILGALVFNRVESHSLPMQSPLDIDVYKAGAGEWISRFEPKREGDDRFFYGCSKIYRKSYYNDDIGIQLLKLDIVNKKTIHPIGICMKSGGASVLYSRQINIELNGVTHQVDELMVTVDGEKYIVYSWFSNDNVSTGDFRKFRLSVDDEAQWRHYQAMIRCVKGIDIRMVFKDFLSNFEKNKKRP